MRKIVILSTLVLLFMQSGAGLAANPEAEPVISVAPAPDTGCYRILFDETHGWGTDSSNIDYTISDAFSPLAEFLRDQGHIVDALQDPALLNTAILERYDVLVLALPGEYYSSSEKADLATFISQGGRLVTIAEDLNFPGDSRAVLNDLHAALGDGLLHNPDRIMDETNNQAGIPGRPLIHTFSNNTVNNGVSTVLQLDASSLQVASPTDGTAFGDDDTTVEVLTAASIPTSGSQMITIDQVNGPIVVQALVSLGSGDIFAIGDANSWDGSDLDSNGVANLDEYDNSRLALNVFAFGRQCTQCRWALFKDRDPWSPDPVQALSSSSQSSSKEESVSSPTYSGQDLEGYLQLSRGEKPIPTRLDIAWLDPNEQILQDWGIPYTIFHAADIPEVDLGPYCKIIVASDQTLDFYHAISDNRSWFETWVVAGGILEFHGAAVLAERWDGLPMPGNFSMSYYETDDISIINPEHLLFKRPNPITDADLQGWNFSAHGYLVNLPAGSLELVNHEDAGQPAAAKFELGDGCVIASEQTLEWAWDPSNEVNSPMLENYLRYDDCSSNFQLYLALALNQ
jgi:hypothetical protein